MAAASMGIELLVYAPDGEKRSVPLSQERITLGRSSANDLYYADDAGLSRQHLAIEKDRGGWILRDLGSKNGTMLNGQRVLGVHALREGDRISAGHLLIEFGAPAAIPENTVIFVEPSDGTGSDTTVITSLEGVLSDDGEGPLGVESSPQMRALIRVGRELSGHKSLPELFQMIMELSVDAVGGARGVLMTLEGAELVVRAARGEGFRISQLVRDRVIREKSSLLIRDAKMDKILQEAMSIVEQQVRSIIAVPLQTDDRVIGLIYVDSPNLIQDFTKEDLSLLTVMANIAAVRIEHARLAEVEQAERLMAREMLQAADIQRGLLPSSAPCLPGLDLAGFNAPCRSVGGDYYDFLAYPGGQVGMLVGDVAGKGLAAALLMSSLQARVQVLFDEPQSLALRMERLNRSIAANCPGNRFITFFFCVIDPATGEMTYCNAGHNPPLVVRATGAVEQLTAGGLVLGIIPQARYQQATCQLQPGDVVVLFSDGVTEACAADSDDDYGEMRLAQTAAKLANQPAEAVVQGILKSWTEWTRGAPPADDATLVIARRL